MLKKKIIETLSEKVVCIYHAIEKAVVDSYQKIEDTVVCGYTKMEETFILKYLARDGETLEDAQKRLKTNR